MDGATMTAHGQREQLLTASEHGRQFGTGDDVHAAPRGDFLGTELRRLVALGLVDARAAGRAARRARRSPPPSPPVPIVVLR